MCSTGNSLHFIILCHCAIARHFLLIYLRYHTKAHQSIAFYRTTNIHHPLLLVLFRRCYSPLKVRQVVDVGALYAVCRFKAKAPIYDGVAARVRTQHGWVDAVYKQTTNRPHHRQQQQGHVPSEPVSQPAKHRTRFRKKGLKRNGINYHTLNKSFISCEGLDDDDDEGSSRIEVELTDASPVLFLLLPLNC